MSMQINIHGARKIDARASHSGSTHWVTLTIESNDTLPDEFTIFFDEAKVADDYAAALGNVRPADVARTAEAAE